VELLERVVGEHGGADAVGDLEDEAVAAADGAGRRRQQLAGGEGLVVGALLGRVDAVLEGGVDDDRPVIVRVLLDEGAHRFVELHQARLRTSFRGDVGTVHDEVTTRRH
jgi:hypothetical protein